MSDAEHTYCPACGKMLLLRLMFTVENKTLKNGRCSFCRTEIPGIFA